MTTLLKKLRLRIVIRRYEMILFGSVMLLSGAVMPSSWEPPFLHHISVPAPVVLLPLPPQHPWIALTFDDGPHPGKTEELLAVLKKENVPATFFVVGKMADRYPQLMRDISIDGHELANHTYSHPNLSRLSDREVLMELERTRAAIRRLTGQEVNLFRPPGGDFNRRIAHITHKAGYQMVLWSVLAKDVEGTTPRVMHNRIVKGAEDGAVVLMHSGMQNTIQMLPKLIVDLRKRGYHFVTMSTLLGLPSIQPGQPSEQPLLQTASKKTY